MPFSKPVIFAKGKLNPMPSKNFLIPCAAICGLAVKTNMSLLPNFSWRFKARSAKGPFWVPLLTFSNSLKSNCAPSSSNWTAVLANSAALIDTVVPSSLFTVTCSFVLAKVSSKSKTLIPFLGVFKALENLRVLS